MAEKKQEKKPVNDGSEKTAGTGAKADKKEEKEEKKVKSEKKKYFYAVGRRKRAVAQVFLYIGKKFNEDDSNVNKIKIKDYFTTITLQNIISDSLKAVGLHDKANISVRVKGGGKNSQAEATRLSIARALVKSDESLKKTLKGAGFLTRDSRKVERKKPGLKKARRAPQWKKR